MKQANRERKSEIKYLITLNDEQREAKRTIIENQVVIITGFAGTGKSLLAAQTALDFLFKKEVEEILVTRPLITVGKDLGALPGDLSTKINPYLEPFYDNIKKCYDNKAKIEEYMNSEKIKGTALQFIRGKTVDDILILEEAQNTNKAEMLAVLTRLGKEGKIVIVGDLFQTDTKDGDNGLAYAIELSKHIEEIKWIKLKENHRSDLVGKILDYEYKGKI